MRNKSKIKFIKNLIEIQGNDNNSKAQFQAVSSAYTRWELQMARIF